VVYFLASANQPCVEHVQPRAHLYDEHACMRTMHMHPLAHTNIHARTQVYASIQGGNTGRLVNQETGRMTVKGAKVKSRVLPISHCLAYLQRVTYVLILISQGEEAQALRQQFRALSFTHKAHLQGTFCLCLT